MPHADYASPSAAIAPEPRVSLPELTCELHGACGIAARTRAVGLCCKGDQVRASDDYDYHKLGVTVLERPIGDDAAAPSTRTGTMDTKWQRVGALAQCVSVLFAIAGFVILIRTLKANTRSVQATVENGI